MYLLSLLPSSLSQNKKVGKVTVVGGVFFLSGVIHAPVASHGMPGSDPLAMASFFWLQGVGVVTEMWVMDWVLGTKGGKDGKAVRGMLGEGWGVDLLRGLWVAVWMYFTLPFVVREFVGAGLWEIYPVPVKVFCRVLGYC